MSRQPDTPRLRFITAASLFDGHDAALHIMRRLIQTHGTEVVHLGHHRSAEEVVRAAVQEDADAIVISSQQGGLVEYFTCLIDQLQARDAGHILVFVSRGIPLLEAELTELTTCGVTAAYYTPSGSVTALTQMVTDVVARASQSRSRRAPPPADPEPPAPTGAPANRIESPHAPASGLSAPAETRPDVLSWWPGVHRQSAPTTPTSPLQVNEIRWEFNTPAATPVPPPSPPAGDTSPPPPSDAVSLSALLHKPAEDTSTAPTPPPHIQPQ